VVRDEQASPVLRRALSRLCDVIRMFSLAKTDVLYTRHLYALNVCIFPDKTRAREQTEGRERSKTRRSRRGLLISGSFSSSGIGTTDAR
jgi:hypothetical protein